MQLQKLLNQMTLQQKLAQLSQFNAHCIALDADGGITGPAVELKLTKEQVVATGSILNVRGVEHLKKLQREHLQEDPNRIPLLFMQDVIHGCVTIYPIPLGLGASFDVELAERCCKMAATEAMYEGINVIFAPMVDLVRDARWGRCMESTGEDVYLNCQMGKAMVKGFQLKNDDGHFDTVACVKHFAGYGQAEAGRDYNTTDISMRSLRDWYLPAYKSCIDGGAQLVMTSFNSLNGVPATANKWLVNDLLRKEWGFDGVVISDYNAFNELVAHGVCADVKDCAHKAMTASVDVEMMSSCYLQSASQLVAEGKITIKQIDDAVMRVLKLKQKMGLFENPYCQMDERKASQVELGAKHRQIARTSAEQCAVLLKNDGVLPFEKTLQSVAVIGPWCNTAMLGNWRCYGKESDAVTVYEGMQNALPNATVTLEKGCDGHLGEKDCHGLEKAVALAKQSDCVVLCVGERSNMSGEGKSRANIHLSNAQIQLVKAVCKANPNTAVVVFCGRPLILTDIVEDARAIFVTWQPGTEGGNAVANLLLGNANFSGKLPMTFPRDQGQIPIYYDALRTGRPKVDDDLTPEYTSCYLDMKNAPLYPFGYGLSYAQFEISPVTLSSCTLKRGGSITARCTVKNVGKVAGAEVLQLYLRDEVSSLTLPNKQLKGFQKVFLAPNEQKEICFEIDERTLQFWTVNDKFEAESGMFTLWISNSSDLIDEGVKFILE